MSKDKRKIDDITAAVRKASRNLAIGKGKPGQFNPNRSVKFGTPTDKYSARGRTHRDDDG